VCGITAVAGAPGSASGGLGPALVVRRAGDQAVVQKQELAALD
jgi:hypothetical protein